MSQKLRKIPLYNKYGLQYPNNLPDTPKHFPKFNISQLPNADEMFTPWMNTVNGIIRENQSKLEQMGNFETFYTDKYLSKKPIGLVTGKTFSLEQMTTSNEMKGSKQKDT